MTNFVGYRESCSCLGQSRPYTDFAAVLPIRDDTTVGTTQSAFFNS